MQSAALSTDLLESNEKASPNKITNQTVLTVTTVLFAAFVIGEVIGALAGNSLSLLGDAAAMSVDVITYITNTHAERVKSSGQIITEKMRMALEVYIPMFSVLALLAVTVWITFGAVEIILSKGDASEDVNVYFLYGFSSGNFLLDLISFAMFYWRGIEVFKTIEESGFRNPLLGSIDFTEMDADERIVKRGSISDNNKAGNNSETASLYDKNGTSTQPDDDVKFNVFVTEAEAREKHQAETRLNLNMCSAFTHLTGDSLRSASVFFAAVAASTTDVSGNLCDAWAAVIVTVTIVILVIPLIHQIWKASYPRPEPEHNDIC